MAGRKPPQRKRAPLPKRPQNGLRVVRTKPVTPSEDPQKRYADYVKMSDMRSRAAVIEGMPLTRASAPMCMDALRYDPHYHIRWMAAEKLGQLPASPEIAAFLAHVYKTETDRQVRSEARISFLRQHEQLSK